MLVILRGTLASKGILQYLSHLGRWINVIMKWLTSVSPNVYDYKRCPSQQWEAYSTFLGLWLQSLNSDVKQNSVKSLCTFLSIASRVIIFKFWFFFSWGLEIVSHSDVPSTKISTLSHLRNCKGVKPGVCLRNWPIFFPVPSMTTVMH